jgi:hypothetical protein
LSADVSYGWCDNSNWTQHFVPTPNQNNDCITSIAKPHRLPDCRVASVTSGALKVEMTDYDGDQFAVQLYSVTGAIVLQQVCAGSVCTLQLSSFPSGQYFLHVSTEKQTFRKKIVLAK